MSEDVQKIREIREIRERISAKVAEMTENAVEIAAAKEAVALERGAEVKRVWAGLFDFLQDFSRALPLPKGVTFTTNLVLDKEKESWKTSPTSIVMHFLGKDKDVLSVGTIFVREAPFMDEPPYKIAFGKKEGSFAPNNAEDFVALKDEIIEWASGQIANNFDISTRPIVERIAPTPIKLVIG